MSPLSRTGAYTTTRAHSPGAVSPTPSPPSPAPISDSLTHPLPRLGPLADESLRFALPLALGARGDGELAVAVIVTRSDLYLHVGVYSRPVFGVADGGARLAVVGGGREAVAAKHSERARVGGRLEKLKGPNVTELLLARDGHRILEGNE